MLSALEYENLLWTLIISGITLVGYITLIIIAIKEWRKNK